jgi:hypothetical protein
LIGKFPSCAVKRRVGYPDGSRRPTERLRQWGSNTLLAFLVAPLSLPDITATTLESNQAMNDTDVPDMPDYARRRAPFKETA